MSNKLICCNKLTHFLRYFHCFFLLSFISFSAQAEAQIVPDATLPINSRVTQEGNTNVIEGGTRAGTNLFHSFQQFSIPTGNTAKFNNALDVQNIFTRITGLSISNINGSIQANGTANLFLINPNGIIFGPNGSLNVGGSFLASTASHVNFADGTQFSAVTLQTTPLLTVSVPVGLQMGSNPGKIVVQGSGNHLTLTNPTRGLIVRNNRPAGLQVQDQTLALIGGEIELIGGNLTAGKGRIELGSVADNSNVSLASTDTGWAFGYSGIEAFRDIQLKAAASLDASGAASGEIQLQGRSISLSEGSAIVALTLGNQPGRNVTLRASENVELSGSNSLGFPSAVMMEVFPGATGNAGNLMIETAQLALSNGALISSSTRGQGNGGNLTIRAAESVSLSGLDAAGGFTALFSEVRPNATGNAGNLMIETSRLTLADGALLSTTTFGLGNPGNLTVRAFESMTMSGLDGSGFGSYVQAGSGTLTVETDQSTFTTEAQGNGSNQTVGATESVNLSGLDGSGGSSILPAGASSNREATGNTGTLTIETGRLTLTDGAVISSSTDARGNAGNLTVRASELVSLSGLDAFGNGSSLQTFVSSGVTGNAGNLTVETGRLILSNKANISSETIGNGNAGDLTISAEQLTLSDRARISVSGQGEFSPGTLTVTAEEILLDNQARLSAQTESGSQGNINIFANSLILRRNSNITTNATGTATGGNITLNTGILAALENSDISANSQQSQGGTVTIDAQAIFGSQFRTREEIERLLNTDDPALLDPARLPSSDITATGANSFLSGTVAINTPDVDASSGLLDLPETPVDATQLVASACNRPGSQQSEFSVTGRGGLPPNPYEAIADEATWIDLRPAARDFLSRGVQRQEGRDAINHFSSDVASTPAPQLLEAQGWVINSKGQVELVAQVPATTPQTPQFIRQQCHE